MAGREQDADVTLHDVGPWRDGTACHDLCDAVVVDVACGLWIIGPPRHQGAVYEIPVDEKGSLNGVDGSADDAHVGVAPWPFMCAFDVSHGDVHASDEANAAIYDAEFAMVAIVHFAGEGGEAHGHKGVDVYAAVAHSLE